MKIIELDIWTSENIDAYYLDHITEENHQEFSDIRWVKVKDEIDFLESLKTKVKVIKNGYELNGVRLNRCPFENIINDIEQRLKQLERKNK
jgi:hypothetical protein